MRCSGPGRDNLQSLQGDLSQIYSFLETKSLICGLLTNVNDFRALPVL